MRSILAQAAQLTIFFNLLAKIITDQYPDDTFMQAVLPILLAVPIALAIASISGIEALLPEYLSSVRHGIVGRTGAYGRRQLVACLDYMLGTPDKAQVRWRTRKYIRDAQVYAAAQEQTIPFKRASQVSKGPQSAMARNTALHVDKTVCSATVGGFTSGLVEAHETTEKKRLAKAVKARSIACTRWEAAAMTAACTDDAGLAVEDADLVESEARTLEALQRERTRQKLSRARESGVRQEQVACVAHVGVTQDAAVCGKEAEDSLALRPPHIDVSAADEHAAKLIAEVAAQNAIATAGHQVLHRRELVGHILKGLTPRQPTQLSQKPGVSVSLPELYI